MKTTRNKQPKVKAVRKKRPVMFFAKLMESYRAWNKMYKYEEEKLKKYLVAKLDKMVSEIVRSRDCAWGSTKCWSYKSCSSCLWMIRYSTSVCAHWIDRWRWSHRRDFRNVFATCSWCNDPAYDAVIHKTELQFKIEWIYGRDTVREMRTSKTKEKPSLSELVELYDKILITWEQIPVDWKC